MHLFGQANKGEHLVTMISLRLAQCSVYSLYELIIPTALASEQQKSVPRIKPDRLVSLCHSDLKAEHGTISYVIRISFGPLLDDGLK